jgi:thiol-disulfide isomerase/thioredoxin
MDDPRMGRLCASLPYRSETWAGGILERVAAKHPDRKVRGQATYALGMWERYRAQELNDGREHTKPERDPWLKDARRAFIRVTTDYADVTSVDGTFRLAEKAKAELTRIANLPNLQIGKVAPEISGEDLDGKPLTLSDHRGKVVVVCFWATWCGPCMAMVPHERELTERMHGRPFALLGVNSDDAKDREKARKVTREKQMTWPSWWDGGHRGTIQTAYDVNHYPTVYVLDAEGVIRYFGVRGKDLDGAVDALLAEMGAGSKRGAAR